MSDEPLGEGAGFLAGLKGIGRGSRVAGYLVEDLVGRGGMAVVVRAVDERLGRRVALKVLGPALAADEPFRRRFIKESRALATMDDPHIIPIFEAGEADGVLFIAMRYVAGGDLRTLVRRHGPLPAGRAAWVLSAAASALDAAHGHGLVHRDVKPANMLVDVRRGRPDHVYVSDFGLSKDVLSSVSLTATGQLLGTPDYMAPEQIESKPVDGRADQYALACAAYELLTGTPPFRRGHGMAVIHAHLSEPPPPLAAARPGLPGAADAVLARALAKSPADRYPTCGDFAESLRAALGLRPYDTETAPELEDNPATVNAWSATPSPAATATSPASVTAAEATRDHAGQDGHAAATPAASPGADLSSAAGLMTESAQRPGAIPAEPGPAAVTSPVGEAPGGADYPTTARIGGDIQPLQPAAPGATGSAASPAVPPRPVTGSETPSISSPVSPGTALPGPGLPGRRLRQGAAVVAIAGAAIAVIGLFTHLDCLWNNSCERTTEGFGPVSVLVMYAALAVTAGICMLAPRTRKLTGPGIVLGAVAVPVWVLIYLAIWWQTNIIPGSGYLPSVGFWLEVAASLAGLIATGLAAAAVVRTPRVRLLRRPPQDGLAVWAVILLGFAGALALGFRAHDVTYGTFYGILVLAAVIWAAVVALIVPACAALAVPRLFGVAMLGGCIAADAAIFLAYRAGYDKGAIIVFGITVIALIPATVLLARARPAVDAEHGADTVLAGPA